MEPALQILSDLSLCNHSNTKNSLKAIPEFSVRIVVCDYYLSRPNPGIDVMYSEFRGSNIKQVPVLRIFGSTTDGRKVCLHIHGVFPYFYIPCPTSNPEPQYLYQIAASLDRALNIALKQATSMNQHVYKISLVKGLPFYGFHDKEHLYLKIFLYNPGLIKQAVDLCSNGAILGQSLQPHESHLNFTLQFFIDFNLFGMSNIDLQKVKFRTSNLSQKSNEPLDSPDEHTLKPESICFYEADCIASHIINRQRVGTGDGIENPGLQEVWNQELERRKQLNVTMASKSLSQGRIDSDETESHHRFENMFLMKISDSTDKPVNILEVENIKNLDKIYYPAETKDGLQLFNATDVSTHLQETVYSSINKTLSCRDEPILDDTMVNEDIALNSSLSLHYSQIPLDSEDLELVDMLQDLDERSVDEDSIIRTPANTEEDDIELDNAEYSQIFDEETICLENSKRLDHNPDTLTWNDSFWEGVTIPQLDGTYDEEHPKKVKKRKMRSFKLGLSKPKNKNGNNSRDKEALQTKEESNVCNIISENLHNDHDIFHESNIDENKLIIMKDELNITADEPLKDNNGAKISKTGENNFNASKDYLDDSINVIDTSINDDAEDKAGFASISHWKHQLVSETCKKDQSVVEKMSISYDLQNQLKPVPGPSNINLTELKNTSYHSMSDSFESSPEEENLGIRSFYNTSKLFDCSIEESRKDCDNLYNEIVNTSTHPSLTFKSEDNINPVKKVTEIIDNIQYYIKDTPENKKNIILVPKFRPPSSNDLVSTLDKYLIPHNKTQEPYYSNHKDVGDKIEIGQMILKLRSQHAKDQKPFEKVLNTISIEEWRQLLFLQSNEALEESANPGELLKLLANNKECILRPIRRAPTTQEVINYFEQKHGPNIHNISKDISKEISKIIEDMDNSQAIGLNEGEFNTNISLESNVKDTNNLDNSLQVTMQPDGSFLCFGNSTSQKESSIDAPTVEMDFLTLMLVEVHASVRGDLNPDPSFDEIQAIFVTITNNCPPNHFVTRNHTEILVVDDMNQTHKSLDRCIFNSSVTYLGNETEIIEELIKLVQKHDPDIMCGYEIEMKSWGYILERAQILGLEIVKDISRIIEKHRQKRWRADDNEFEGRIIGRITFNVWRLFRHELALSSYSFENCMYEILKERVSQYSYKQLSEWWNTRMMRWITVEYYLTRLFGTVRMLEKLDIINRTSELARLFGLQWWEVLSRGSQFRVESLMLRAARPLNLVALSPTVKQRAAMRAPECLPLIFEPESRFYTDPVIVLDFQSLYPSMMIAYNYCFSTCIGRVQNISGDSHYEFGAWRLRIPKAKLQALQANGLVHWSPVGVGFVRARARRGVLPALLRRILAARQAVKKGMKLQTDDAVKKAMHSRQLGLKLIANVTYGYTAANFSGRMPCVEVGDSVVAKGRETLERAIALVRRNHQWNAKVVYGDTDSLFVLMAGASRARAFDVGQQIADAVTADNPSPVALKLEKVYQPCILQTKKRYVGYMYESPEQEQPVYEAKGIETVRRDGCPAGVKLLQQSLCELFSSGDVSRVRRLVTARLSQLAAGALSPLELVFTREYHGPAGYRPGAAAPPNEIAKRLMVRDRRAVPRAGERVRWAVAAGAPHTALVRLARAPRELLADRAITPHVAYYATRALLPPLHRCFSLIGVDVFKWWREVSWNAETAVGGGTGGIARYLQRGRCAVCGARGARSVCLSCAAQPQTAAAALTARSARASAHLQYCYQICDSCCGHAHSAACENTECPVLWRRVAATNRLEQLRDVLDNLPPQFNEQTFHF